VAIFGSKSRLGRLAFAGVSLVPLALSASCSGANQVAPSVASAPPAARLPNETLFESWRSMMERLPKPENACLTATYPEMQWRSIPCAKPPSSPLLPVDGIRRAEVGDGTDFSAVVTGYINAAEGGFQDVTGVKSEYAVKHGKDRANTYSLQLNTQFFSTETCASLGSPDPANCFGWEQFAYDTGAPVGTFIEYWLANFGPVRTPCPTGWHKYALKTQNEVNCWINSALIPTPIEPVTALEKLRLVGSASYGSRSQDFAELIVGYGKLYYVAGQNWFPDLNSEWQDTEFNILGDCCGDQAMFNTGSTIVVRTEVDSGATTAPTCDEEGFTAESNNLFLTTTRSKWQKAQYPSVIFTETNDTSHSGASCATEGS
jgi:hypothetical protein